MGDHAPGAHPSHDGEGPLPDEALRKRRQTLLAGRPARPPSSKTGRELLVRRLSHRGPGVILGHFRLWDYRSSAPIGRFGTIFREPVSHVLSHFGFMLERGAFQGTLDEYISRPEAQNVQSRYLAGCEVSDLDFVGIAERFRESLVLLGRITGLNLGYHRARVAERPHEPGTAKRAEIARLNAADVELYEQGLDAFRSLQSG